MKSNDTITLLFNDLEILLNNRVSRAEDDLLRHGDDESFYISQPPKIVV